MKIWCFDHASLSYNIHSDLYFSKEEAQERYDAYNFDGAYRKLYQVEDIWGWCARNFKKVVNEVIASRDNGDNFISVYGMVEELEEAAQHCGVEHYDISAFWLEHDNQFVLTVAWFHDGKLHKYTDCFYGLANIYKYPTIVERRSKWEKKN